jgi:hypothetical protein
MFKRNFILSSLCILVTLLAIGCASVDYVGKSFDPSTSVDMYFSEKDIEKDYTVIGHAIGMGGFGASTDKIQEKLIEEAKRKGADAVLITGLGNDRFSVGESESAAEKHINASFIKYK